MASEAPSPVERDRLEEHPLWKKAAAWFIELRSEQVSSERIAEWLRWLEEDPQHQRAFDAIAALGRQSPQLNTRWPSESEVASDGYTGEESISAWRERSAIASSMSPEAAARASARAVRRRALAATAPLAIGAIALLAWLLGPTILAALQGGARIALSTDVGEIRTVTLPDGSLLTAGGKTSLVVVELRHARSLTLERGEVFLRVAKDRSRPFTVRTGTTAVTAVGTAFDVRRTEGEAVVAVAEGIVRVSDEGVVRDGAASRRPAAAANPERDLVREGQQWRLEGSGATAEVSRVDPDTIAAWREGRLQYLDEPLELVVADLARYSRSPILLKDERVARMRMTGVVFPQDIDTWLSSLEVSLPVRVHYLRDGHIEIEQK